MKRLPILMAIAAAGGLFAGLPLLFVTVDDSPPTPDVHALDCFSRARQGALLDDRERWTVDDAREQWQSEQAQSRLPAGCWAVPPFRCGEDCR